MLKKAISGLFLVLAGCGTVDEFSSRVSKVNDNVASADADDVVRNIVRAAHYEPMTFVAVSKITGLRTADLKIGLPTITLGKGQTTAQKQFSFAGNLLDNSLGYTLEMSPLRTDTFTKGLMQSVDPGEFESLGEQGYPRELLFYLLIDSITLDPQGPTPAVTYHNAPWHDDPKQCPNISFADFFDRMRQPEAIRAGDQYAPFDQDGHLKHTPCEFHNFQFLLMLAIEYGLRVNAATPTPPADAPSMPPHAPPPEPAAAAAAPADRSRQRLCFDLGLANTQVGQHLITGSPEEQASLCSTAGTKLAYFEIDLHQINAKLPVTHMRGSILLRSPFSVFHYLGQMILLPPARQPQIQDPDWAAIGDDRALFPLTHGSQGCYVHIAMDGNAYCLPHTATTGKAAISVTSLLLQMNTNRSDLPTSAVQVGL